MHLGFVWVGPGFAPVMDYVLVSWMSGGIFHTRVASVLASGWARLVLDSLFLGGYLEVSSASRVRASRAALGRVRNCSEAHGSGRVGSGRVKRFSNLVGRVRSGQGRLKSPGSGRLGSRGNERLTRRIRSRPARNGSLAGRVRITRELFSTDPRVGPTRSARGSDT